MFWRVEAKPAEISRDETTTSQVRLLGRAKRLKAHLGKEPNHPKAAAYREELKGILEELGARKDMIEEILG